MSTEIRPKQLNIEIKSDLLRLIKAKAITEGKTVKEWAAEAFTEKLNKSAGSGDQAEELRRAFMKEAQ